MYGGSPRATTKTPSSAWSGSRNVHQRSAHDIVVIVSTVDGDVAAAPKLSGGRDHDGMLVCGIEIRGERMARRKQGQLEVIAPVQRQVLNVGTCNDLIDGRRETLL